MPRGLPKTLGRAELKEALRRHRGKVALVADELGVSRQTVYTSIKDYGLAQRKLTAAERRANARAAIMARWSRQGTGESSAA